MRVDLGHFPAKIQGLARVAFDSQGRGPEDGAPFPSAGALVLNCPGCGSKVADDAAICNVCDYIIDTSFLSAEPPGSNDEDDDEGTGAKEDPRPAPKPAAAPARPRPASGNKSGSRAAMPAADSDSTNVKSMEDIVRSAPPRPAGRSATGARGAVAPTPPRRPPPPKPAEPEPEALDGDPWDRANRPERGGGDDSHAIADTGELMAEAREFMGLLSSADKIAFWGAVTVALSCFLPWKSTAVEEDVLGLMSLGFGAFLLSIAVIVCIGTRVRGGMRGMNPVVPWMGQLVTSFLCLVWCIIFIKVSSDTTRVPSAIGNMEVMNSSPSIGVFIAVLGALAALGGSVLGLRNKSA
jgi:hypothetical protein